MKTLDKKQNKRTETTQKRYPDRSYGSDNKRGLCSLQRSAVERTLWGELEIITEAITGEGIDTDTTVYTDISVYTDITVYTDICYTDISVYTDITVYTDISVYTDITVYTNISVYTDITVYTDISVYADISVYTRYRGPE